VREGDAAHRSGGGGGGGGHPAGLALAAGWLFLGQPGPAVRSPRDEEMVIVWRWVRQS